VLNSLRDFDRALLRRRSPVAFFSRPQPRPDANADAFAGIFIRSAVMDGHPLQGMTFGVVGTITPLVDLCVEEHQLPAYMRAR
jgi:hypothetical protein